MNNSDPLKLENQLCFPLYACAKEVVRKYKPFLDKNDLTYTQYITMMVMWEHGTINVKELGKYLYLDSGTLTPLLKKLEQKGYIKRSRDTKDERVVNVTITQQGKELKSKLVSVPGDMSRCISLTKDEAITLYRLLYKILAQVDEKNKDE
jgi:DNA-binding MarR family transcriptional regulator